jgi:dolichol-phosphate mannosyltransferase
MFAAGDIIVGMDTDFSHSPYDIPRFVTKIREGFDVVVASRYMHGGQYQINSLQTLRKSVASRLGNILIHILSGVPVHDFTTALRAIKREVVYNVETESKGNSFFMEFIIKAYREGYRMTEVPIVFRDRITGKSKLSLGRQSLRMILDLLKLTRNRSTPSTTS